MPLIDAATCLDDLANGRLPNHEHAMRGVDALDVLLLRGRYEPDLHEAAATLELIVATDGLMGAFAHVRPRAAAMAAAVRRAIENGRNRNPAA